MKNVEIITNLVTVFESSWSSRSSTLQRNFIYVENSSGDYGEEVPPVLIPNTVVKLLSADDIGKILRK